MRGIMMTFKKLTLKSFMENQILHEKKKKKKKKRKSVYTGGGLANNWFNDAADSGAVGESLIVELLAGILPSAFSANINTATVYNKNDNNKDAGMTTYPSEDPDDWVEEEPELKVNKVDQARQVFQAMYNKPNATRADIINTFMKDIGVTNSTAVSYYTRFLDEFGLSSKDAIENNLGQGSGMGGMGDPTTQHTGNQELNQEPENQQEIEQPINPDKAGIIRTVDNAHLIYKRQTENGSYQELWIYNLHDSTNDELEIRRDILAGTDIPAKKTKSADGQQSYNVTTMGNAQLLKITGLPN